MKTFKKILPAIAIVLLSTTSIWAQTPPPSSSGGNVGAPIDGLSSLLLVAGAGYGIRKFKKAEK